MTTSSLLEQFFDFHTKPIDVFSVLKLSVVLTVVLAFLGVGFVLKLALRRRKYGKIIPSKGHKFLDILGNFNDFPTWLIGYKGYNFNVYFLQFVHGYSSLFKNEKICCFWLTYLPFVLISKAEAVEAAISGTKMMKKGWTYTFLHPWLGTGLLTSHGSKWKTRRKLLTPSFHFDILKDFIPIFNEQSQELAKQLQSEITKEYTDIVMPVTLCSLDIICETTLGITLGAQANSESQYVKSVLRASDILMQRMVKLEYWFDFFFQFTKIGKELDQHLVTLHNFTRMVIQEKKTKLLSGRPDLFKRKRRALMDLLLEHHLENADFTEEDIREEVDTFAFEGHDTTSMGISWALYLIGLHKDVQDNIHEELDRIFGDDKERHADSNDLKDMTYLDCVLKESQRLYPSVPIIARHVDKETDICGHTVPSGASVIVISYLLHRDEKVFPNPEKFDPNRFLPENSAGRHPFAYIPFSAGPRNCIGQRFAQMEEKIVVSTVLRHFTVESLDPRDKVTPAAELILRSSGPIRIKIRPRR